VNVTYEWRGGFENSELNALHARAFEQEARDDDWERQVSEHSLGWVCARAEDELVGFVNVAWDGGVHAFVLETIVADRARRRGIGARLVAVAADESRAAGCECGFTPTNAGLISL
jgi:GNAT superfamily N-acetyltransferase